MNSRALAAKVVLAVINGSSLPEALASVDAGAERDQAFLQALCYGVCRWYFRLDAMLNLLLDKPLKTKDQDIHCLMLVGLFQLSEMRVPPHAAVAETVAAVKTFKKIWAKGLVNAVLRNYQRNLSEINDKIEQDALAFYAHPKWMMDRVVNDWPEDWQAILLANNQHPPLTLRINQQKITREQYLQKLAQEKIDALPVEQIAMAVTLNQPMDVERLPGFKQGEFSVQDGAAQYAAVLLDLAKGQRILDAAAAPGGKTAHILECEPGFETVVALDRDSERLKTLQNNLTRLNLSAKVICADAADTQHWWDGKPFDRILLDAPCSASGVIRRHPDIKLLRRESDIAVLAKEQLRLLTALWPLLKPGGLLVYVTCSVFSEENTRVLASFLASTQDATEDKIQSDWGKTCPVGKQILPGMHGMDGFYFACLRRNE